VKEEKIFKKFDVASTKDYGKRKENSFQFNLSRGCKNAEI